MLHVVNLKQKVAYNSFTSEEAHRELQVDLADTTVLIWAHNGSCA